MEMLEEHRVEWKKTGCSVMSDGWTDKKRRYLCNFLVNSPKGSVFLSSIDMLDISKTVDKVFKMLDDVVEKVGEENVVQIITDNAANYKAVGDKLMEKRKNLYWTPFAAHCIDLILEDLEKKVKVHKSTIVRARKVASYIYRRTLLISTLRHFTKGRDLIRPVVTQFATAYLTLGSLSDLRCSLMTIYTSKTWKSSKYVSTSVGHAVQEVILDSRFWKNIVTCLKAAYPLIKVLRMVDSDEKPTMGFIYEEMRLAREKIKSNFNGVKQNYEPILTIVDERWELQLHRPLHAAAYYLNPRYHYSANFKVTAEIKIEIYKCIERMVSYPIKRCNLDMQLEKFKDAEGVFGIEAAKLAREKKAPAKWWDSYGDECPELQNFAIHILSLICSSSGCERNWSAFERVHTKRRNRLFQKKMNELVFVMCNMNLLDKSLKKNEGSQQNDFENLSSDDEWITEESYGGEVPTNESDNDNSGNGFESHEGKDDIELHDANIEENSSNRVEPSRDLEIDSNDVLDQHEDSRGDGDDEDDAIGGALDGAFNIFVDSLF